FQQLLIAAFLGYLIVPAHHWLIRHRLSPFLSVIVLLGGFLAASTALGLHLFRNIEDLSTKLPTYQQNVHRLVDGFAGGIPGVDRKQIRECLFRPDQSLQSGIGMVRSALGTFFGFLSQMVVIVIYMLFLLAEQASFARRIGAAFEPERARQI